MWCQIVVLDLVVGDVESVPTSFPNVSAGGPPGPSAVVCPGNHVDTQGTRGRRRPGGSHSAGVEDLRLTRVLVRTQTVTVLDRVIALKLGSHRVSQGNLVSRPPHIQGTQSDFSVRNTGVRESHLTADTPTTTPALGHARTQSRGSRYTSDGIESEVQCAWGQNVVVCDLRLRQVLPAGSGTGMSSAPVPKSTQRLFGSHLFRVQTPRLDPTVKVCSGV